MSLINFCYTTIYAASKYSSTGVKQLNLDRLEEIFLQVSDPKHEQYGHYLSLDEIRNLTSNYEGSNYVKTWLTGEGTGLHSDNVTIDDSGNYVSIKGDVTVVEKLFQSSFKEYHHLQTKVTVHRTDTFVIPEGISHLIDFHGGTTALPSQSISMQALN